MPAAEQSVKAGKLNAQIIQELALIELQKEHSRRRNTRPSSMQPSKIWREKAVDPAIFHELFTENALLASPEDDSLSGTKGPGAKQWFKNRTKKVKAGLLGSRAFNRVAKEVPRKELVPRTDTEISNSQKITKSKNRPRQNVKKKKSLKGRKEAAKKEYRLKQDRSVKSKQLPIASMTSMASRRSRGIAQKDKRSKGEAIEDERDVTNQKQDSLDGDVAAFGDRKPTVSTVSFCGLCNINCYRAGEVEDDFSPELTQSPVAPFIVKKKVEDRHISLVDSDIDYADAVLSSYDDSSCAADDRTNRTQESKDTEDYSDAASFPDSSLDSHLNSQSIRKLKSTSQDTASDVHSYSSSSSISQIASLTMSSASSSPSSLESATEPSVTSWSVSSAYTAIKERLKRKSTRVEI